MFDSYSQPSDKETLKIGLLIIAVLVAFSTLPWLFWTTTEQSAEEIERSELLTAHDESCLKLPRPPDFHLLSKRSVGKNGIRSISYNFESKLLWSQVTSFYLDHFQKLGWTVDDRYELEMSPIPKSISFAKDKYRITLEHVSAAGGSHPGEYAIGCSKIVN